VSSSVASATSALVATPTNKQWNTDCQHHRDCDDPDREQEIYHDADRHDGDDPRQSVAHGETVLHAEAIGLLNVGS
jgi:hypothetical protein